MQTLKGRTAVFAGATAGDGRDTVRALCERVGSIDVVIANTGADGHRDEIETLPPEELRIG